MVYIAYVAAVVLLSAVVGGLTVHLIGSRRLERAELLADIQAAETAPVPLIADITSMDPGPPARDPAPFAFQTYPPAEQPAGPPDGWQTTAMNTGDLSYVRQQLDLDDFALWMEQRFYELLEQTRTQFDSIQITG